MHLYRHFNKAGELLYVGISLSTLTRLGQHKKNAKWFGSIASVTVEHFSSREEALEAETKAIITERPLYNIACNPLVDPRCSRNKSGDAVTEPVSPVAAMVSAVSGHRWVDVFDAEQISSLGIGDMHRLILAGRINAIILDGKCLIDRDNIENLDLVAAAPPAPWGTVPMRRGGPGRPKRSAAPDAIL